MNSERTIELAPAWSARSDGDTSTPARRGTWSSTDVTLLDTFDRRLFRRGKVCALERLGDGTAHLVLRTSGGQRPGHRAAWAAAGIPRFASDVPESELRAALEGLIDVRALLPLCRLRRSCQIMEGFPEAVPDAVRLFRTRYSWVPDQGRPRLVDERLAVSWSAPDDKTARHFVDHLLECGIVKPVKEDIWHAALGAAGRLPPADEVAGSPELTTDLRADVALRRILATLFEIVVNNEAGIIDNIDSEFLHDFRVAVRRSRAVLGQLKGVFPERSIRRFAEDLAWLGAVTGPMRDLDVYLLHVSDLEALLPHALGGELEPLRALLTSEAAAAHAALVRYLSSARYRHFKQQWPAYLARPPARRPAAPNALEPIGSLAGRRIWTLYRRISKAADVVDENTPSERIHELRKTCKKLRYLLEYVEPLHPADRVRRPIRDLKALQDHLGAFQDAEVQMDYLREWFSRLRGDAQVSSQTLLALGMLFGRFEQRQSSRRAEIPPALRRFARKEERARFKSLFKEPVAGAGGKTRGDASRVRTDNQGE